MSKNVKNGDVMNKSNHLQEKLDWINEEYYIIQDEFNEIKMEYDEKLHSLNKQKDEIITNDFPIKEGDKIITKKEYQYWLVEKTGKTDRSIKYKEIHKDYVKGVVDRIVPGDELGNCRILLDFPYQKNITNELECSVIENTNVSLDTFNKLYQVDKN